MKLRICRFTCNLKKKPHPVPIRRDGTRLRKEFVCGLTADLNGYEGHLAASSLDAKQDCVALLMFFDNALEIARRTDFLPVRLQNHIPLLESAFECLAVPFDARNHHSPVDPQFFSLVGLQRSDAEAEVVEADRLRAGFPVRMEFFRVPPGIFRGEFLILPGAKRDLFLGYAAVMEES